MPQIVRCNCATWNGMTVPDLTRRVIVSWTAFRTSQVRHRDGGLLKIRCRGDVGTSDDWTVDSLSHHKIECVSVSCVITNRGRTLCHGREPDRHAIVSSSISIIRGSGFGCDRSKSGGLIAVPSLSMRLRVPGSQQEWRPYCGSLTLVAATGYDISYERNPGIQLLIRHIPMSARLAK